MAYTCHLYLYFIKRLGLVRFCGLFLMLERPLSEPPTQSSDEPDFGIRGPMLSFRRVVLPRSLPLISTHVRVLKSKLLFLYLYEKEYRTQNTNSIGRFKSKRCIESFTTIRLDWGGVSLPCSHCGDHPVHHIHVHDRLFRYRFHILHKEMPLQDLLNS